MNSSMEVTLCDERKANKPDGTQEGFLGGVFFGWVCVFFLGY